MADKPTKKPDSAPSEPKAEAKPSPAAAEPEAITQVQPPAAAPAPQPAPAQPTPSPVTPPAFEVQVGGVSDQVRAFAQQLYDAYVKNSRGLAWDGRKCPTWDALGDAVRSHWCAVALRSIEEFERAMANAPKKPEATALVVENERLKEQLSDAHRTSGQVSETRVSAALRDRTKMLDAECDKLRGRVAQLEKQLREKS